eukprot:8683566-Alexandrium_andersonii.AAC.1
MHISTESNPFGAKPKANSMPHPQDYRNVTAHAQQRWMEQQHQHQQQGYDSSSPKGRVARGSPRE